MKDENVCPYCGCLITEENETVFDGTRMCESCFEEKTTTCQCCGDVIWKNDAFGDDNINLCRTCYTNYYVLCSDCDAVVHVDNAYYTSNDSYHERPYCSYCYEEHMDENNIKDYNYKPEPEFYGDENNLYIGVELEIDGGGEEEENAAKLLSLTDGKMYCKHDGSIDDGFEMVTHPMTLSYHEKNMPWRSILKKSLDMGYCSHKTVTCGLHCHVNRDFFGENEVEQESAIGRIVFFVEKFWDELLIFSRRTEESINRWASRYGIENNAKITYEKAKKSNYGRYMAVNLTNSSTVEFRMFRGSLKYSTFISVLQLVNEICHLCKNSHDKTLEKLTWGDFVKLIPKKKESLISYLKQKQLWEEE